jgi:hypothetical protein
MAVFVQAPQFVNTSRQGKIYSAEGEVGPACRAKVRDADYTTKSTVNHGTAPPSDELGRTHPVFCRLLPGKAEPYPLSGCWIDPAHVAFRTPHHLYRTSVVDSKCL